jgi:hypothetical protein
MRFTSYSLARLTDPRVATHTALAAKLFSAESRRQQTLPFNQRPPIRKSRAATGQSRIGRSRHFSGYPNRTSRGVSPRVYMSHIGPFARQSRREGLPLQTAYWLNVNEMSDCVLVSTGSDIPGIRHAAKRHCVTAAIAAGTRTGSPDTTCTSLTSPVLVITYATFTTP